MGMGIELLPTPDQLYLHNYVALLGVLLCYDWLLTLDDEVNLVWMGPKTSAAWLFLFSRYFAIISCVWPTSHRFPRSEVANDI